MPDIRRGWTAADVRQLIDESRAWPRYELIDGELLVTPAPRVQHQLAVGEIYRLLANYLDAEPVGVALTSPADLELHPDDLYQPDVFVLRADSRGSFTDEGSWQGFTSLLLAVEVLSPSNERQDRVTKRDRYMAADVAEYWIVDLDSRVVERWTRERMTPLLERETLRWRPAGAATELVIDLPALFFRVLKTRRW